jgi:hypothetical protein
LLSSFLSTSSAAFLEEHLSSTPILLRAGLAVTTWYFSLHIFFAAVIVLLGLVSLAVGTFLFERRSVVAEMARANCPLTGTKDESQEKNNNTNSTTHNQQQPQKKNKNSIHRSKSNSPNRSFSRLSEEEQEEDSEFHTARITQHQQRSVLKRVPSALF